MKQFNILGFTITIGGHIGNDPNDIRAKELAQKIAEKCSRGDFPDGFDEKISIIIDPSLWNVNVSRNGINILVTT